LIDSLLHSLIGFASDHAAWAYATVFLGALLEAIPVAGSFVPGTTVIVGISALVSSGRLDLGLLLAAATLGGALGDAGAFLLGHRIKRRILSLWPLSAYPHVIAQSEEFFRRRGTFAVFFARFVAPVRAFVPVIAGALGMPPRKFFAVNIPAVFVWAAAHVVISAFAGAAFAKWSTQLKAYALPAIAVVMLIGFAVWAFRHWRLCAPDLPAGREAKAAAND
jgi:membrane-associated protein